VSTREFEYKNSIEGIVERIAFELGDAVDGDSYAAFDKAWIKARVYDTFKWLQGRRPSLFSSEEKIDLMPGAKQCLPTECDSFIEPVSIEINGKSYPVHETDYSVIRAAQAYNKLSNCMADSLCVFHASVDDNNIDTFWLSPPIPAGSTGILTAKCSNMSRYFKDCDAEINCEIHKWVNTVIEYVKFVAFATDGENAVSGALADQHRATFFDLAPVQRRQEG